MTIRYGEGVLVIINVHFEPDLYCGTFEKDYAALLFILKVLELLLETSIFATRRREVQRQEPTLHRR